MNGRTNVTVSGGNDSLGGIIPLDPPTSFIAQPSNARIELSWTDPKDKYATPEGEQMEDTDQLVSKWAYTKIVRKEGSQPTNPNDGVIVLTSSVYNEYQSTIYIDQSVVNGVVYYYAVYAYNTDGVFSDPAMSGPVEPYQWSAILDDNSWKDIDDACTLGVHTSLWEIGDEKEDISSYGTEQYVIIGFDLDQLSDKSGAACITFSPKHCLPNQTYWRNKYAGSPYNDSSIRTYVNSNGKSSLPATLQNYVLPVRKKCNNLLYSTTVSTIDDECWLFAFNELGMGSTNVNMKDSDFVYPYYASSANRIKYLSNTLTATGYFTRSIGYRHTATNGNTFWYYHTITNSGEGGYERDCLYSDGTWADYVKGYAGFGFCIGKTAA